MKSNEIIREGPLDFAKRVGAGIKGAMDTTSDFRTGYQQAGAEQQLADYAKKSYPAWNQAIVALRQQGVPEPQLGKELQDWATDYFGVQAPAFSGPVNSQSSMEYLKKLWAMKMYQRKPAAGAGGAQPAAGGAQPAAAAGQPSATTGNAAPTTGNVTTTGGTTSNAAPTTGATTAGNAAPTTGNVTTAGGTTGNAAPAGGTTAGGTTAGAPTKGPNFDMKFGVPLTAAGVQKFQELPNDQRMQSMQAAKAAGYTFDNQTGIFTPPAEGGATDDSGLFKDPAAFKDEWDKFISSKPNYRLIADPELLSALKDMWMRTGGLKAESKKNKGKRV